MTDDMGDKELMMRFQEDGTYDAFERLFHRHRDGLFGFLLRLSGNDKTAEEVSQAAWLKLLELARRGGYRSDTSASFRTFLFTLARNEYIDQHVRKHDVARTESLEGNPGVEPSSDLPNGLTQTLTGQLRRHIDAALATLPFEQREVITLWAAEFTIEQMAAATGAPRDTVLSRKKYALKKLRQYFDDLGVHRDDR